MNRRLEKYLWFYVGPLLAAIATFGLTYYPLITITNGGALFTTPHFGISLATLIAGLLAGCIFGSTHEYAKVTLGEFYK